MLLAHRCARRSCRPEGGRQLLLLLGRRARHLSSGGDAGGGAAVTFPNVGQGGSLQVRILRVPVQIRIKSAWIDHTELSVEAPPDAPALEVTEAGGGGGEPGAVVVSDAKLNFAPNALLALAAPYRLTATVPEKFNLQVRVQSTGIRHGAILTAAERAAAPPVVAVEGKVEGDVEVLVRHGDVRVGKLRGPRIELGAEHGCVSVGKYVEGDISVRAQRLHARMLKGSRIRVRVSNPGGQPPPPPPRPEGYEPEAESDDAGGSDDVKREPKLAPVTVEALFGNSASVLCTSLPQEERGRRAVDITRSHGDVKVVVTGGGVHLGGVNGSATVQTVDGPLDVRFEAIAPGTANTLATRRGRVELLMAPEIKAGLEVQGFSQRPESLLPEGPNGFELTSQMGTQLEGRFTGARPEPSRKAARKGQGQGQQHDAAPPPSAHGKGKIDLSGAEAQALKSFFVDRSGKDASSSSSSSSSSPLQPKPQEPSILVKLGGGQLSVRTISWMDAIKRQFGLSHIDYSASVRQPKA